MKRILVLSLLCVAGVRTHAADIVPIHHKYNLPPCEPGYKYVEETCYKEVCRYVCKLVPDIVKTKKWVYSTKEDPFCIKESTSCLGCLFNKGGLGHGLGLGHSHKGCGPEGCAKVECPSCNGPHCRLLLVKKEVVCEEPSLKCVVEKVVEVVPYTVCKKVPCTTNAPGSVVPAAPPASPLPLNAEVVSPPAQKLPAPSTPAKP